MNWGLVVALSGFGLIMGVATHHAHLVGSGATVLTRDLRDRTAI
jgi:hypothetical protein